MSHSGEFWENVAHWRRKWQTTQVFLQWEHQEHDIYMYYLNNKIFIIIHNICAYYLYITYTNKWYNHYSTLVVNHMNKLFLWKKPSKYFYNFCKYDTLFLYSYNCSTFPKSPKTEKLFKNVVQKKSSNTEIYFFPPNVPVCLQK